MSKRASSSDRPDPAGLGLPAGGADSHAHLDLLCKRSQPATARQQHVDDILARAGASGVSSVGQVFLNPDAYLADRSLFATHPGVFFLLGIHPNEAMAATGQTLEAMRRCFLGDDRLRAVGEIGLDFYWKDCPPLIQEEAFRLQLSLARELDLPVVIHSREAAPQTVAVLEAEGFTSRPVLWHCFGGDDALGLLDRMLANGWHVSVPGPVTYPANEALRRAVARIPPGRLLLETDCPYLSPQPWRGKPNQPAYTVFTAQTVARALELETPDLWRLCGDNTRRFFGLGHPHVPGRSSGPTTNPEAV